MAILTNAEQYLLMQNSWNILLVLLIVALICYSSNSQYFSNNAIAIFDEDLPGAMNSDVYMENYMFPLYVSAPQKSIYNKN